MSVHACVGMWVINAFLKDSIKGSTLLASSKYILRKLPNPQETIVSYFLSPGSYLLTQRDGIAEVTNREEGQHLKYTGVLLRIQAEHTEQELSVCNH